MIRRNELVYICSPLSAPTEEGIRQNMKRAEHYVNVVSERFLCRAIAPHSFLLCYLDDNIPAEREIALRFGLSILEISKAMIVCGDRISEGMRREIRRARELQVPVYALVEQPEYIGIVLARKEIPYEM